MNPNIWDPVSNTFSPTVPSSGWPSFYRWRTYRGRLYETSKRVKFDIKSTEAQHYRRFLLQRRVEEKRKGERTAAIAHAGYKHR